MKPFSTLARFSSVRFVAALLPGILALKPTEARAATQSFTFTPAAVIPDGTTAGLADAHTLSSSISILTDVNITLNLDPLVAGGFNGDLFVTLVHDTGFSVLLNRVGRTSTAPFGYSDQGFAITVDDQAADNVHTYRTTLSGNETTPLVGTLTGNWKPDGRTTDPFSTLTTDASTANLGSFNGTVGSGEWILFVADVERGAQMQLSQWTLTLTGASVPESSTKVALVGLAGAVGWLAWRRGKRN